MGSNGTFTQRLIEAEEKKKKEQANIDLGNRLTSMEEQLSFLKKQNEISGQGFMAPAMMRPVGQTQAGLRINQGLAPSRVRRMNRAM